MKSFSLAAARVLFWNCCNSSLKAKRLWRPASSLTVIIQPRASGSANMAVSPARLAAFNILLRVERESAYAVDLLHSALLDELSPVDRHLVTEIVMGVLRWRSVLDQTIALLSFTPFRKLDLEVLTALRIGVYQKQFLSKIPAHASVNETVELVKQAKRFLLLGWSMPSCARSSPPLMIRTLPDSLAWTISPRRWGTPSGCWGDGCHFLATTWRRKSANMTSTCPPPSCV